MQESEPAIGVSCKTEIPMRFASSWQLIGNKRKVLRLLAELNYYLVARAHEQPERDNEYDTPTYSDGDELELFLQTVISKLKK